MRLLVGIVGILALLLQPEGIHSYAAVKGWDYNRVEQLEARGAINMDKAKSSKKKTKKLADKKKEAKKETKKSKSMDHGKIPAEGDRSPDDGDTDGGGDTYDKIECDDSSAGVAPETICNEWIPGIGYSDACEPDDTEEQGGGVCNLVSKSWLETLGDEYQVDLVINHAGLCRADIEEGDVTGETIYNVLPYGLKIVLVEMTGREIVSVLQQAAIAAHDGEPGSYPYGSGIRYKVDFEDRDPSDYVYDIEVNSGLSGSWKSISHSSTYLVATNALVSGGGADYNTFNNIPSDKKTILDQTDSEVFLEYVTKECVVKDPPSSEYSTQEFDGLNALISSDGAYSCLEDESLCECGFCD